MSEQAMRVGVSDEEYAPEDHGFLAALGLTPRNRRFGC